jgi:hypothetical protein
MSARVVEDDRDDRDVDVREDVRGHPQDGHDAEDDDEHRHHDERVRALQRHSDEPHHRRFNAPDTPPSSPLYEAREANRP